MKRAPLTAQPPFVIFALPRSRTAWLSEFLSYGNWSCSHEELRHFRSLDDVRSWLSQPCTGTAETAAAPWWRLLLHYRPDARVVVVRRPVAEVVDSLMRLDNKGTIAFDRAILTRGMLKLDAKLDQIEKRVPNALTIRFDDLAKEATCAAVFEHCLPYNHDHNWWSNLYDSDIQASMPAMMRYVSAYRQQLEKLAAIARQTILAGLASRPLAGPEGFIFQEESFDSFYRDGQNLFKSHLSEVDDDPDITKKNIEMMRLLDLNGAMQIITARCNGRMFGYIMTVLSPSLKVRGQMSSVHSTFYASPHVPGLGLKLHRQAIANLSRRGVNDVFMRAAPDGKGPKMGNLYKRLGAQVDGQLYRLQLMEA